MSITKGLGLNLDGVNTVSIGRFLGRFVLLYLKGVLNKYSVQRYTVYLLTVHVTHFIYHFNYSIQTSVHLCSEVSFITIS